MHVGRIKVDNRAVVTYGSRVCANGWKHDLNIIARPDHEHITKRAISGLRFSSGDRHAQNDARVRIFHRIKQIFQFHFGTMGCTWVKRRHVNRPVGIRFLSVSWIGSCWRCIGCVNCV